MGGIALLALPQIALVVDAAIVASRTGPAPRKPYQKLWVYVLLGVIVWSWSTLLQYVNLAYWSEAFVMPTRSMQDTLYPGDCFLVDKLVLHLRGPRRGDVVAHRADEGVVYCRRVIGLPGEVVEVREERIYLNGQRLDEPYAILEGPKPPYAPMINAGPLTVGEGKVYLLGDHRRMSKDSRVDGFYELTDVLGVARVVYWSREYKEKQLPTGTEEPKIESGRLRWERIGIRLDDEPR